MSFDLWNGTLSHCVRTYTVLHLNNLPYYYEILSLNNLLHLFSWRRTCYLLLAIVTALKRSLRRLCFHRCLSVHRGRGMSAPLHAGIHPPGQIPPQADTPRHRPPLRSACWDMVNKRSVRIPLECILVVDKDTDIHRLSISVVP